MFKLFNESCNLILMDGFMNSHIIDGRRFSKPGLEEIFVPLLLLYK